MEISGELKNFSGKFDPRVYVEGLSSQLLGSYSIDEKSASRFDPAPFLKSFEGSLEQLTKLRKLSRRKIGDSEDLCLAAEKTYQTKVSEIGNHYGNILESFEKLENRMSEVGNSALLIGEQLRSLEKQRIRAQEARDLVLFFIEFNAGTCHRIDAIKNTDGWNGKTRVFLRHACLLTRKAAQLAKRLSLISKEADLPSTEKARLGIEKYCEEIEKELLNDFDQAYKDSNHKDMAIAARVLIEFNGGHSCVQTYINQNAFFIAASPVRDDFIEKLEGTMISPLPDTLEEYSYATPKLDVDFLQLFEGMKHSLKIEWNMIYVVFPNASAVMQQLIQRIFAQSVQSALEIILKRAEIKSMLEYLRILAMCHAETADLIQHLKGFLLDSLKEPVAVQSMTATLNRCKEDLFVPYVDNEKYYEKELKCLQQAGHIALRPFVEFQNQRKLAAKNRSMFSKLSSATAAGLAPVIDPLVGFNESFVLSGELVETTLQIFRDSVKRCREVAPPSEIPRYAFMAFGTFLDTIGLKYIEAALDIAIENLLAVDPKSEPDFRFLQVVQKTNESVYASQKFYQAEILPLIIQQSSVHRETVIKKNNFVDSLESKLNVILNKLLTGVISWTSAIISKQKKTDYKPKDSELVAVASLSSTPCTQAADFLRKTHTQIVKHLDGRNVEMILMETSLKFYKLLLEHIKKFQINTNGGLLLTKYPPKRFRRLTNRDLAMFQQTMALFKIPGVVERFETLRQIGNIYIVRPESLKTLLEDGTLARMDPEALHAFVANRSDYKSARLDLLFKGMISDDKKEKTGSVWEKTFEDAVEMVGDTFEEVGESLKKILVI